MKRQLFIAIATMLGALVATATDIPEQALEYEVFYHCSFINERAANASVVFGSYNNCFNATIGGCSVSIFGMDYCVNDTLHASFATAAPSHVPAQTVSYVNGYYRKHHSGQSMDLLSPEHFKNIYGGGSLDADASTMEYVSLTADMLSMFYYAKAVDFSQLPQGEPVEMPVYSDYGETRTMQVTYCGITECRGRQAWNLIVNFSYGGEMSAYPMHVYIDPGMRVPLEFAASLSIGQVQMVLI